MVSYGIVCSVWQSGTWGWNREASKGKNQHGLPSCAACWVAHASCCPAVLAGLRVELPVLLVIVQLGWLGCPTERKRVAQLCLLS